MDVNMKYKFYIINYDIEGVLKAIKDNTDNRMVDILFGTKIYISKIFNNNIILIARTFNSFKKNFYCSLQEDDSGVLILGEFKFNLFIKILFTLSLISIIIIMIYLLSSFSHIKNNLDKIMFFSVLFILLSIEVILFLLRKKMGNREKKIIINFIIEKLKAIEMSV